MKAKMHTLSQLTEVISSNVRNDRVSVNVLAVNMGRSGQIP